MRGKKVRCLYADGAPFVKDAVYTLAEDQSDAGKWKIAGFDNKWWNHIRFVSIHGVRCLDNQFRSEDGDPSFILKVGQVYKVIGISGDYSYALDTPLHPGYGWRTERFMQVWIDTTAKNYDPDEERLWMLMRPHIAPDECVCGIKRVACDYHRR